MARSSSRAKPFAVSTSPVAELPAVTLPVALILSGTLCSSVCEMDAVFPAGRISDHVVAVTRGADCPHAGGALYTKMKNRNTSHMGG